MKEFDDLVRIIRRLRAPGGCPWDRAQKLTDYKKYLIEESYELIDSIDAEDARSSREELGDLFLILVIISEFFRKKREFEIEDVLKSANQKLVSRHPHVFSSKKLKDKEEVLKYWTKSKARKKQRRTVFERLPKHAPAIFLAQLLLREKAHIDSRPSRRKKALLPLARGTKNKKKLLLDAFFDLVDSAAAQGLDLEDEARKAVLSRAKRAKYR